MLLCKTYVIIASALRGHIAQIFFAINMSLAVAQANPAQRSKVIFYSFCFGFTHHISLTSPNKFCFYTERFPRQNNSTNLNWLYSIVWVKFGPMGKTHSKCNRTQFMTYLSAPFILAILCHCSALLTQQSFIKWLCIPIPYSYSIFSLLCLKLSVFKSFSFNVVYIRSLAFCAEQL